MLTQVNTDLEGFNLVRKVLTLVKKDLTRVKSEDRIN